MFICPIITQEPLDKFASNFDIVTCDKSMIFACHKRIIYTSHRRIIFKCHKRIIYIHNMS